MQAIELHHRFHSEVLRVSRRGLRIELEVPSWKTLEFAASSSVLAAAIEALQSPGATLPELKRIAGAETDRLDYYLGRFRRGRLLEWALRRDGADIAIIQPLAIDLTPGNAPASPARPTLSRFAYMRRVDAELVLESPETPFRAILRSAAAAELAAPAGSNGSVMQTLWRFGFCEDAAAPEPPARASWEFHDRLMHAASRFGRDGVAIGGTYRFKDKFPSPPSIKPPMSNERVALDRPELQTLATRSRRLIEASEARRSNREWSAEAVPLATISELLFRVARITKTLEAGDQQLMLRPIPGGGAVHELEFYVAAQALAGARPGLFHYRGLEHALDRLPNSEEAARRVCEAAAYAIGQPDRPPPVVIVMASRLPRLAWKYAGIAYRITLMNAGGAIHALYMAVTDMNLAGTALGSGDNRPFMSATGLDPLEETPVAEFAFGLSAAR